MKNFDESIGQHWARVHREGARKPLRTITELAEEFGVSVPKLSAELFHKDGPPSVMKSVGFASKNTWYDPIEVRKWWKQLTAKA